MEMRATENTTMSSTTDTDEGDYLPASHVPECEYEELKSAAVTRDNVRHPCEAPLL